MTAEQPYGYPPAYANQPAGQPIGYPGYPGYPAQPQRRRAGIVGAVISSVGALIAIVGLFLNWYSANGYDTDLRVIVNAADATHDKALAHAVFGWLLWVLLGLTIVAALLANLPGPLSVPLRVLSPLLGLGCAAVTVLGVNQLQDKGSVFDNASVGLYALLAGAVIAGFGGVVGPRRR